MSAATPDSGVPAVQVVTTTASQEAARRLAALALREQRAACVQIDGPIESHYVWQGELHSDPEWRCTFKTTAAAVADLQRRLLEEHPYEEPEILVVPVTGGSPGYLAWLNDQVRSAPSSD